MAAPPPPNVPHGQGLADRAHSALTRAQTTFQVPTPVTTDMMAMFSANATTENIKWRLEVRAGCTHGCVVGARMGRLAHLPGRAADTRC